jgi:methionyl-tRNA formyltransferase
MIKILFAGSPDAARLTLERLFEAQSACGFEIAGVLSNPPSAKGRHKELIPTPVAAFAAEKGIPVFTPEHLDGAAREAVSPLGADLLVSFAYGHIFGPKFLALFPMGGINLHPSLLPKYRGCTPVPAAILNRDKETAVTVQSLSLKMDEGDILAQTLVNLNGTETGQSLLNYSAEEGAKLILEIIKKTASDGKLPEGQPQTGDASYTGIIKKEDGRIKWSDTAEEIEAKIRAYYPEPGCWCMEKDSPLRILEAGLYSGNADTSSAAAGTVLEFSKPDGILIKTGKGILAVKKLQRQGKNAMDYISFMNGARNFIGTVLL